MALPYFSRIRLSSEPALTPIRIEVPRSLAALAISLTWSSNLRMLPGLTRTAAQPASMAAKTYFGWKWMSAMTGIWRVLRDRRQRVGVVLARAGHPHDVAAGRGQLGDLLEGGVDVGGQRRGHRLHRDRVRRCRPRPCRPGSGGSGGAGPARAGARRACPGRWRSCASSVLAGVHDQTRDGAGRRGRRRSAPRPSPGTRWPRRRRSAAASRRRRSPGRGGGAAGPSPRRIAS